MDFHLGRYRDARVGYLELVRDFPSSDWAWVAALRAAEAREALGDVKGAAAEYEELYLEAYRRRRGHAFHDTP